MALIDAENRFSNEQAVTVTADATNVIDMGAAGDPAGGTPLFAEFCVTESFTSGATATAVTFSVFVNSTTSSSSAEIVAQSAAIPKASLTAGARVSLAVSPGADGRYLGAKYTVSDGPATAGKITAYLSDVKDTARGYPKGYTLTT